MLDSCSPRAPRDAEVDRRRARLARPVERLLASDNRRLVIVGASGWIGRTAMDLLHEALGADRFAKRVVCFGSAKALLDISEGRRVQQQALADLPKLERVPTLLLHLAFQTKDKIAGMDPVHYAEGNRALSGAVRQVLDIIGVDRLFVASSGAAAFADDPAAPADLRLYGQLKRQDEVLFSSWAEDRPAERRAVIGRIYNVSGPWINKHRTYALASFVLDALEGRPITVESPWPVARSYVAVRELLSVLFAALLAPEGQPVLRFETGGEALELAEVAKVVAQVLGGTVARAAIEYSEPNLYVGDNDQWQALLARCGIEHLPLAGQVAETAAWLARESQKAQSCSTSGTH